MKYFKQLMSNSSQESVVGGFLTLVSETASRPYIQQDIETKIETLVD